MKRKSSKLTAIMLSTAMCVTTLAGCGGSSDTTTAVTDSKSTESTEAETTSTETTQAETIQEAVSSYAEAPMLAEQVSAGTLPGVEERMPITEDVMVEAVDSIGTYGGSFEWALAKAGWNTGKPIEQGLFRFKEDGSIEPNVAKGYEVNDDATVFTIHLREGMKWSDGVDFTAADCVFFYDHMCVPETFGKSLYDCFKVTDPSTGETTTATFAQVDDYTFTVSFEYPKPDFLSELTINAKWCFAPKHYHETILPEFVGDEKAAQIATDMGYSDTASMLKDTGYYFWNVSGVPTLNPYVLSTEEGKNDVNGDYYEFVRNPYFWKVDQEGNQLPYIDSMNYSKISDESQTLIKTLAGEITITTAAWADIETLTENAETVGYNIYQWPNSSWADNASQFELNQTAPDEAKRAIFQEKDFRQALSIAVDREEYAKLISDGWVDGKQASPAAGTLGYSEEWSKKWTEYDPEQAKSLLEGLGLVMGSDGYYDLSDGSDFVINILSYTDSGADSTYQILDDYWKKVGIKTTYKPMDKDTLNNKIISNDYDAVLSPVAPAETINIMLRPDTLVPVRNYAEWYGEVGTWYASGGEEGIAPTGDLLELCNLFDQFKAETNSDKRQEIALQMLALHEENIWVIGYMDSPATLFVVDNKLKNFKESSIFCDEFRGVGIAHLECCYFAE